MRRMRTLILGAAGAALVASSVAPAMARDGRGWGDYRRHHRHHDRIDAGDVIAGLFFIGAIAAVASAASKSKNRSDRPDRDDRAEAGWPDDDRDRRDGAIGSEDAAVDACARAVEDRAGSAASVRDISRVESNSDGWDVEGTVEQRRDWRDREATRNRFNCTVRYGAVEHVYIDGDAVAVR